MAKHCLVIDNSNQEFHGFTEAVELCRGRLYTFRKAYPIDSSESNGGWILRRLRWVLDTELSDFPDDSRTLRDRPRRISDRNDKTIVESKSVQPLDEVASSSTVLSVSQCCGTFGLGCGNLVASGMMVRLLLDILIKDLVVGVVGNVTIRFFG